MFRLVIIGILFLSLYGCEQQEEKGKNEKEIVINPKFDLFINAELNRITGDYIEFLKNQPDTAVHNQYVMMLFSQKEEKITFSLLTGIYIAMHFDTPYEWVYMTKYDGCKLFISDLKQNPIAKKYYDSNSLVRVTDPKPYISKVPYTDIIFDERAWNYEIVDDKFILIDKTY